MPSPTLALQLYSVRDLCKVDMLQTLRDVATIGYRAVEFAGLYEVNPPAIRATMDELGLVCAGAHVLIENFAKDVLQETLDTYRALGCENLIVPWVPENVRDTLEAARDTARRFTVLTHLLEPRGFRTGYHQHDSDCRPLPGSEQSAWEVFAENTPEAFALQHDTGNSMVGGMSSDWTFTNYPTRCLSVHMKEFPLDGRAIGEGEVNWGTIVKEAERVGTQWLVVEHEIYTQYPPLEAARRAFEFLSKMI